MLILLESAATDSVGDITPTAIQSIAVTKTYIRMGSLLLAVLLRLYV